MSKHTKFIPSLRSDQTKGCGSRTSSRIDSTQGETGSILSLCILPLQLIEHPHARFVGWPRHTEFIPRLSPSRIEGYGYRIGSRIGSTQRGTGLIPGLRIMPLIPAKRSHARFVG